MVKLDKVKWGFIGCGEVTEKKSGPAFALIEGSEVVAVIRQKTQHSPLVLRSAAVNRR